MKWEKAKDSDGPEKKGKKKGCLIVVAAVILLVLIGGISRCGNKGEAKEPKALSWPTVGLATMLPDPGTDKGEINSDSADYLSADLAEYSLDKFNDYVEACKEKGFTVDYLSSSTSYSASTAEGYDLSLHFYESSEELSIHLSAPSQGEPTSDEAADANATAGPEAPVTPEAPADSGAPAESAETPDASSGSSDFRAMVDEYEAYMNDYCDFMQTYNSESGNVVSMAIDYAKMMAQYSEWASKIDAIDESTLSAEDDQYFIDAQTRINQRLLEVGLS